MCVCVWEHSVLVFPSRSDVGLFLAVFSQEPLAGFNCLFFFPILYLCAWTSACLPSSPSVSLSCADRSRQTLPQDAHAETRSRRRACRDFNPILLTRFPLMKTVQLEKRRSLSLYSCFSHCFPVFLLKEMGTQKEKTSLLFKTSREELKL